MLLAARCVGTLSSVVGVLRVIPAFLAATSAQLLHCQQQQTVSAQASGCCQSVLVNRLRYRSVSRRFAAEALKK
jgi:hypothetical protein